MPYEGIIKSYFDSDNLSTLLREKYMRYKALIKKNKLSDDEYAEIDKLEYYLDEIPDYLALDISTEYRMLKHEFEMREEAE